MPWRPWDDDWYPPSRPIAVRGGIRAQSKRGGFGESWWAARWIAVLESLQLGGRLQRGRSYARRGQVLSIEIAKGEVSARVQGSRDEPYDVLVKLRQLTASDWRRVAGAIAGQAIFAAKLLAGEMPNEIEAAFGGAGLSLFPRAARELATRCSCPDSSNPCKHIAAVYYLLGEEFDRDPFLLFRLRGIERDELLTLLRERQATETIAPRRRRKSAALTAPVRPLDEHDASPDSTAAAPPTHPLLPDPARFWHAPALADDFHGAVERPHSHAALVRRLGRFPFWRAERAIADAVDPLYAAASDRGLDVFLAATPDNPADGPHE